MDENLSLREIRERLGLTQQELADALGMARAYISAVERGASPFSDKFRKKVENLSFNSRAVSLRDNHGALAVGSPGARVHNTATPTPSGGDPPAWAEALRDELRGELARLRGQLADIQALLVKLAGK